LNASYEAQCQTPEWKTNLASESST
jgi:hypothetical protein